MEEILLIDKPKGITSFDVIRRLQKKYKGHKFGHAGTLDPLASGLMIIGVDKGTKKLAELIKLDKTYEAEIILGEKRNTGDLEGDIIEEIELNWGDKRCPTEDKIKDVLLKMKGVLNLPVPMHSAIKRGGEPLYKKARRGEDVKCPIKEMEVQKTELYKVEERGKRVHVFVRFEVGSGTYIRSLAEEFGRRLKLPATLGNLRRTKVGEFDVKNSKEI